MDPIEALESSIDYGRQEKKNNFKNTARTNNNYLKQEVELNKTPFLFFPPGKEFLFLGIYFATLPYITGLLFLFFYVSEGKASTFGAVSTDSNFFLVWTIGYEILAVLAVLWIIKNAISYSIKNSQAMSRSRRQPPKKRRRY